MRENVHLGSPDIPPAWIIEEEKKRKQKQEEEERKRKQPDLPIPEPPPGWEPERKPDEEKPKRGVTTIELHSTE